MSVKQSIAQEYALRAKSSAQTGLASRDVNKRQNDKAQWKRDLTGRANGTIDPYYGCFLLEEAIDYALNFTFPWNQSESNLSLLSWLLKHIHINVASHLGFDVSMPLASSMQIKG